MSQRRKDTEMKLKPIKIRAWHKVRKEWLPDDAVSQYLTFIDGELTAPTNVVLHASAEITIKEARSLMAKAFKKDPDFRRVYVDNIACLIMDRIPGFKRDKAKRDRIASDIIKLIFES